MRKKNAIGHKLSPTGIPVTDYCVYNMSLLEKIIYALLGCIVGALVGYIFYGGIGKDTYGNATSLTSLLDVIIPSVTGITSTLLYLPIRRDQIIAKRKKTLHIQFRDLLDTLSTSIGAGKNVPDSFHAAYDDLKIQYPGDAFIVKELEVILSGISNNINLESMLLNFGERSGIDDIISFGNVFDVCYRKGGNIKDVIRNTYQIISDKIEIEMEIQTMITSNKSEQYIMTALPIAIVGLIKFSSPDFAHNFTTPTGLISTTIAIGIFLFAFYISKNVLSIEL